VGKSPEKSRLIILVDDKWLDHPKIDELREKGHWIDGLDQNPHLILHPSAHMWDETMWPLLAVTLKAARARKKGQSDRAETVAE
jgi:hypothetical protein